MASKKTSFPKQDIRVLLLEGVSQTAVEIFQAAGYSQIEYHSKALPEDELKARISEAHIVGLRSRTHPNVPKQQGINLIVLNMKSPDIETRPI
ncbi:MAG TPA: hypothetical protein PKV60_10215, partial [Thermomonas sp.]|nr:hypothetical protein [Thermomonas sp.]